MSSDPDYIYDPEHWETTYAWGDRHYLEGDSELDPGEIREYVALKVIEPKWLARVVATRDEYGRPDETELRWFDTEAEALAATTPKKGEGE